MDSEMKVRIRRVSVQMMKFYFFFGAAHPKTH